LFPACPTRAVQDRHYERKLARKCMNWSRLRSWARGGGGSAPRWRMVESWGIGFLMMASRYQSGNTAVRGRAAILDALGSILGVAAWLRSSC